MFKGFPVINYSIAMIALSTTISGFAPNGWELLYTKAVDFVLRFM
jgi:hypothetical protein